MSWWNTSWSYRKKITIDHTKVSGSHSNFPVLISLSSDSDLSSHAQTDGDDIAFIDDDDSTQLDHEIESYDSGTGELIAWVKIPSGLNNTTDKEIYMYFGNSGAANQENASGVWDSDFDVVSHDGGLTDSTSNNHDGTNNGTTSTTGKIGDGRSFDGVDDSVALGSSTNIGEGEALTVSAWVTVSDATPDESFVTVVANAEAGGWALDLSSDGGFRWYCHNGSTYIIADADSNLGAGDEDTWIHVVGVYDGSNILLYIDGVLQADQPSMTGNIESNAVEVAIGMNPGPEERFFWFGNIDEVRISDGNARSADWIATEYANQNSPGTFFSVGNLQVTSQVIIIS